MRHDAASGPNLPGRADRISYWRARVETTRLSGDVEGEKSARRELAAANAEDVHTQSYDVADDLADLGLESQKMAPEWGPLGSIDVDDVKNWSEG